jgi:uncharacterized protein YukE
MATKLPNLIGKCREEIIVGQEDLTRLKYIEVSRMKLLNEHGITTIKQLYEMPEEKLAGIKSIGGHYAKLIKKSASEYYREKGGKIPPEILSAKERKIEETNRDLQKMLKKIKNNLNRVDENLKPLGKKKFLELYVDFKKKSTNLKVLLDEIGQMEVDIPNKAKKKIIGRADGLNTFLRKWGKKPKKKRYKDITYEIQSFTRMLGDVIS